MSRFFNINVMSVFFTLLASSFIAVSASAQSSREVTPIDPPIPTTNDATIEVLEFFSYGCIHCANLEPALQEWKKKLPSDVKFRAVPAGINLMGVDEISLFYTLEAMGQLDRLTIKIFEALHNDRVMLGHKPTLLKWLDKQGVNPAQFESVEKSFSVNSKVMRGRNVMSQYKVTATPAIVVNGRFQVTQVGGASNMFATVDRLIAEARAANSAQAAAAAPAKAKPAPTTPAKPTAAKPVAPAPAKAPAPSK